WSEGCPVPLEELRYLNVSFWGFDERFHTGELIVHESAAEDMVEVFRKLHEMRFPIEQMRVESLSDLERPPTGDGNETSSFVCRAATGSTGWSMHAYGLAIDVNTFQNPYVKGDLVLPELASAYLDRSDVRPGMILPGDPVVEAFAAMGWEWGGDWNTLKDYMHFSSNGR
ncbi:MAG TPA: M15 family metallopeptidase, partial [Acidimicrobiia bacterium]|nr:M15 family metallopeptidase [Acidimicrobiia bacterium]